MGEVPKISPTGTTGLMSHMYSLLDNRMFSDVEISFEREGKQIHKMYGHKLILALRSEYFESLFYKCEEKIHQIKVPGSERYSFYLMLKFLYTDDVELHTIKDAQDLYTLAERYNVKELKDKCLEYLLQEKVTLDNILQKYNYALNNKVEKLLQDCRAFVSHDTISVIKSVKFSESSFAVIEDIVKNDKLSIPSELDIILAVMQWGKEECKRKKMALDNKSLRHIIEPFLKHLRFLSLTGTEFGTFVQLYDVFSSYESSLITQKLFAPDSNVNVPKNISCLSNKRGIPCSEKSLHPYLSSVSLTTQKSTSSLHPNNLNASPSIMRQLSAVNSSSYSEKYSMPLKTSVKTRDTRQKSQNQSNPQNNIKQAQSNKVLFEVKLLSPSPEKNTCTDLLSSLPEKNAYSNMKSTRFRSSPNLMDNVYRANNVPVTPIHFLFPLSKNPQRIIDYSFERDITCYAVFKMKNGCIRIHGFELGIISQKSEPEEFSVNVTLNGFKGFEKPSTKSYRKNLVKDTLTIMFADPVILREGSKGELEVAIDKLILNRCCRLDNQNYEINNGISFVCTISASSTQKLQNKNSFFYLINRLFYTRA